MTYFSERGLRDGSSPVESFSTDGSQTTRKVWFPWEERFLGVRAVLGYSALDRDPGTQEILGLNRLVPLPHPDIVPPGYAPETTGPGNMWATAVTEMRPFKPKSGIASVAEEQEIYAAVKRNDWTMCEATVRYESPSYACVTDTNLPDWPENEAQRFVVVGEQNPTNTYITMPGGSLQYAKSGGGGPTGIPIGFNVGKVFTTRQFKVTWKRLPYDLFLEASTEWAKRIWGDPANDDYPLIGTVNKFDYYGYKAGTLLLENVIPKEKPAMFGGLYEYDFEFIFNHDTHGWNRKYYFRSGSNTDRGFYHVSATGTYQAPGSVTDDTSIYNERDFNLLFDVRDNP